MTTLILFFSTLVFAIGPNTTDKKPQLYTFPLHQIRAGQLGVGEDYAFYKALQKAKLSQQLDWKKLSSKDKQQLILSLEDELSEGIPVFIAPNGNVHAFDQHHDMFVLLKYVSKNYQAPIDIQRDFRKEFLTDTEFKEIIKNKGWVYGKYLEAVLDKPLYISELADIPERSVTGMCLMHFEDNEDIPMKGKHFVPFIQFLLVDFLKDNSHMSFQTTYNFTDVQTCIDHVRSTAAVRNFLSSKLLPTAPKKLIDFLK